MAGQRKREAVSETFRQAVINFNAYTMRHKTSTTDRAGRNGLVGLPFALRCEELLSKEGIPSSTVSNSLHHASFSRSSGRRFGYECVWLKRLRVGRPRRFSSEGVLEPRGAIKTPSS